MDGWCKTEDRKDERKAYSRARWESRWFCRFLSFFVVQGCFVFFFDACSKRLLEGRRERKRETRVYTYEIPTSFGFILSLPHGSSLSSATHPLQLVAGPSAKFPASIGWWLLVANATTPCQQSKPAIQPENPRSPQSEQTSPLSTESLSREPRGKAKKQKIPPPTVHCLQDTPEYPNPAPLVGYHSDCSFDSGTAASFRRWHGSQLRFGSWDARYRRLTPETVVLAA